MTEQATQQELRENLRTLMSDRELRHRDLAEVLGLPITHVSNRMNAQWFTRDEVSALAEFFEMSVDELMGGSFFKDDARVHNRKIAAEARRQHWEAHRAKVEAAAEAEAGAQRVRKSGGRALCCECGTLRAVAFDPMRGPGAVPEGDLRRGRMVAALDCATCKRVTSHAVLKRAGRSQDVAEKEQSRPSADDLARVERDRLVRRLEGFAVDVHFRELGRREQRVRKGGAPLVSIEFDASKSTWRMEVAVNAPPTLQLPLMEAAWEVIAEDDQQWWDNFDGDPTTGAYLYGNGCYADAVEGLIDEIHRRAPAVLMQSAREAVDHSEREVS